VACTVGGDSFRTALPHWHGIRRRTFQAFGLLCDVNNAIAESRMEMLQLHCRWKSGRGVVVGIV
jgi:hypothetical protein